MIPLELLATFIIAGSLEIIIPLILGLFLWSKLKADWRVWGVGAGMFLISFIRIPFARDSLSEHGFNIIRSVRSEVNKHGTHFIFIEC